MEAGISALKMVECMQLVRQPEVSVKRPRQGNKDNLPAGERKTRRAAE